jgi:hypothetical protein
MMGRCVDTVDVDADWSSELEMGRLSCRWRGPLWPEMEMDEPGSRGSWLWLVGRGRRGRWREEQKIWREIVFE